MLRSAEEAKGNQLLGRIADRDLAAILPRLEAISLSRGALLAEQRCPVEHLYFPTTAVISVLQVMEDGTTTEAATIGREGVVGISAILGAGESLGRVVVQVGGGSVRLGVRSARRLSLKRPPLRSPPPLCGGLLSPGHAVARMSRTSFGAGTHLQMAPADAGSRAVGHLPYDARVPC